MHSSENLKDQFSPEEAKDLLLQYFHSDPDAALNIKQRPEPMKFLLQLVEFSGFAQMLAQHPEVKARGAACEAQFKQGDFSFFADFALAVDHEKSPQESILSAAALVLNETLKLHALHYMDNLRTIIAQEKSHGLAQVQERNAQRAQLVGNVVREFCAHVGAVACSGEMPNVAAQQKEQN